MMRLVPDQVIDRTKPRHPGRMDVRLALAGMCLSALLGFGLALVIGF